MSDKTPDTPFFGVQRVYAKGLSLEIPAGAKLFLATTAPALNLAIQAQNSELSPTIFDVTLRATLTATDAEGKPLYLVEIEQAGVFEIRNATEEQKADMLEIGAPSILSPYLRAQLADVLTRATLPAFFMPEINWQAMAADARAKRVGAAADEQFAPALH